MLLLIVAFLLAQPRAADHYPPPAEFARGVRRALQLDYEVLRNFTYRERRRDVKISKLGKVTIGPVRTFEVVLSEEPGGTYKRLVEIDGRPLTAAELAQRDADHDRDLRRAAERARTETPSQRAERTARAEDERRHRDAILDDAIAAFEATFVGREIIAGQPVLVADLQPRPGARPSTKEGRWMKQFAGRVWVAEHGYQLVKLEMEAHDDVTIGWGIIGRVHKGSRLSISRQRFEDAWLPSELSYQATGRTLLFRPFDIAVTTTYSDYRRRPR